MNIKINIIKINIFNSKETIKILVLQKISSCHLNGQFI